MDADGDALAVGLFPDNSLDMNSPLEAVDASDLAFTALVRSTDNRDLVVFADGNSSDLSSYLKSALMLLDMAGHLGSSNDRSAW